MAAVGRGGRNLSFRELQARAWSREYARKGALWRGPASFGFRLQEGARVLEIGCGNGKTLSALARQPVQVTAIDSSPKAVEMCSESVAGKGLKNVKVMFGDACALPFRGRSFDAVVAFHVLENLLEADRRKAAGEIGRVLAEGGRLFVQVFSARDMRFGKGREVEDNTFVRGTGIACHYFGDGEVEGLFEGFKRESRRELVVEKTYGGARLERHKLLFEFGKRA